MKKEDKEKNKIEQDKKTLSQTDNMMKKMAKVKMKRHVKEENEPVLDSIIDDFQNSYGNLVAAKSAIDILKLVKNGF